MVRGVLKYGLPIALSECRHSPAHNLHVLLRHRPPSIPQAKRSNYAASGTARPSPGHQPFPFRNSSNRARIAGTLPSRARSLNSRSNSSRPGSAARVGEVGDTSRIATLNAAARLDNPRASLSASRRSMRSLLARRVRCCMCHRIASPARATRTAPSQREARGGLSPRRHSAVSTTDGPPEKPCAVLDRSFSPGERRPFLKRGPTQALPPSWQIALGFGLSEQFVDLGLSLGDQPVDLVEVDLFISENLGLGRADNEAGR
jgi:hypothetical protein